MLREKIKIFLPKSANLIGVIDTKGVLEEGEVFINIVENSKCSSDPKIKPIFTTIE